MGSSAWECSYTHSFFFIYILIQQLLRFYSVSDLMGYGLLIHDLFAQSVHSPVGK